MKDYPFIKFTLLFTAGILVQPVFSPPLEPFIISALILLTLFIGNQKLKILTITYIVYTSAYLMIVYAGILSADFQTKGRHYLPENLVKEEQFYVRGVIQVIDLPFDNAYRITVEADSVEIGGKGFAADPILLVRINDISRRELMKSFAGMDLGSRIEARGVYFKGRERRNPGEFDYNQYLRRNGISGIINLQDSDSIRILSSGGNLASVFHRTRIMIDELLSGSFNRGAYGLLKGLILADKSSIDQDTKTMFVNSGVIHVLAVSGLHVGFIALIFLFIFGRLNIFLRYLFTAAGLLFFMFLTGMPASVFRAVIMALIVILGRTTGRSRNIYNSLAAAAFIILLIDPSDIYDPGFQLSFSAVLSIAVFYPVFEKFITKFKLPKAVRVIFLYSALSLSAQIGTFPLTAHYYSKLSIVSLPANLFVIPLIGLLLGAGLLFVISWPVWAYGASAAAASGNLISDIIMSSVDWAGSSSYAYLNISGFSGFDTAAFYGLLLVILFSLVYARKPAVRIAVVLMTISAYYFISQIENEDLITTGKLYVIMADVGQGDSYIIVFPNGKTALIDAGESSINYCNGERVLMPLLTHLSIEKLDYAFISHFDNDHYSGMVSLIHNDIIRKVYFPEKDTSLKAAKFLAYLKKKGQKYESCSRTRIEEGGAVMYIMGRTPEPGEEYDSNENSLILKLVYGKKSFLFTGDINKDAEKFYLGTHTGFLKADVLKAAHHGSKYSSSAEFINAVQPKYSLISAGVKNKFGHPSPEVLYRLENIGSSIFRTDKSGAVILASDGENIEEVKWR